MRNAVQKLVGVALIGLIGAFALPMAAGAQTNGSSGSNGVPPDPPAGGCTFDVTPNPIAAVPQQVTISGTAPTTDNTHVVLYVNGSPAIPNGAGDIVATDPAPDGSYTLLYTITSLPPDGQGLPLSVNFTFGNQNAYTAVCTGPGGVTVIRVKATEAVKPVTPPAQPAAAAKALAFTGSSDTPSYVLIGIAAIVVGAVLVVAARRRSHLS